MVRTKVSKIATALGVLIAFAMTPRAALAVTLEDFPSSPIVQYKVGSAPSLLTPTEVLGGQTNSKNVYPDMSIGQVFGGYNEFQSGRITNNTGTTAITDGSSYGFDQTTPLTRKYNYVVGNWSEGNIPSGSTLYMDFYFVSDDWSTFPISMEYSVVSPSLVQPVQFEISSMSGRVDTFARFLPCAAFVVDEVKYYRSYISNQQSAQEWTNVPNSAGQSMRYPYHAQARNVNGLKGFVVRGHLVMPSYSTSTSYDYSFFFGMDNLKVRIVLYDSDVMEALNGTTQTSPGVPVSDTIVSSTRNQTNTIMDTSGSTDIVSGLTDGGPDAFVARFGFVSQTIQLVTDFYNAMINTPGNGLVHFPGVTVLGVELIPEQDVSIGQAGLRTVILDQIRPFLNGLAVMTWVFWIYKDFRYTFLDLEDVDE